MPRFVLESEYIPQGDQPSAIDALVESLDGQNKYQTLLGVTGSGKTFTMAEVIESVKRPALVIAPNKTLAAQLCSEFREFFSHNAVEYFVSYYDYYQPEAYIPHTDTYIEKDSSINEEIDRLRHSATSALLSRDDVVIVASVSCIYGLGSPEEYLNQTLSVSVDEGKSRQEIISRLVEIHYERNDLALSRGKFRVRGDVIDVYPAYREIVVRIELFDDIVERISEIHPVTGEVLSRLEQTMVWPATHFLTASEKLDRALGAIEKERKERVKYFEKRNKLVEAHRINTRTKYDLEMLRELGYCNGIENYSRHLSGRGEGEPPNTLLDFFPPKFLTFIDESHITVPQIRGMYRGDRARKENLVDYGWRLPSALDNRPLNIDEFFERVDQVVFVSATPGEWEIEQSFRVAEQIIRPTGLVDPMVEVRPTEGQIDDLIAEIKDREEKDERVLVTTLTKKMAESLTDYLLETGVKARYLHSEINTVERVKIIRALREGEFDVLVGINLLREGLDLPEVSLVAILDADKEGFLRSERSLIQTMGRASRNVNGKVMLYALKVTGSMKRAIMETQRRRQKQIRFNQEHGIDPQTIQKRVYDILEETLAGEGVATYGDAGIPEREEDAQKLILSLEEEMRLAADEMRYEQAARIRDRIIQLKEEISRD